MFFKYFYHTLWIIFNYINSVFHIPQVFNFNKYIFPFSFFFDSALLVYLKHIVKHNIIYRWKNNYGGFFIRNHESKEKMGWNNENVFKKYCIPRILISNGDFSLALKEK